MAAKKLAIAFCKSFGLVTWFVAMLTIIPIVNILLHDPDIYKSKGDEKVLRKVKPYVIYLDHPNNLPHLCRAFRVSIEYKGQASDTIIEASAVSEPPIYSESYSTYSFSEFFNLSRGETKYLSYYLPRSSRVAITSCGKTASGSDKPFTIPIFTSWNKLNQWRDSDMRYPNASDAEFYAQFTACPSLTTFTFKTDNFTTRTWYFSLGSSNQDSDGLRATLDLQFTKRTINETGAISGNCTATTGKSCILSAPSGNEVYLTLNHNISSVYPYSSLIRITCDKHIPTPCVLYFLVVPLSCSLLLTTIWFLMDNYCSTHDFECCCNYECESDASTGGDLPTLISVQYIHDRDNNLSASMPHERSSRLEADNPSPPPFEHSSCYPDPANITEITDLSQGRNSPLSFPSPTIFRIPSSNVTESANEEYLPYCESAVEFSTNNPRGDAVIPRGTIIASEEHVDELDDQLPPPPDYDTALSMMQRNTLE